MPRINKFSAKKTVCGAEHLHDSKAEAKRCDELSAMEQAGEITHLTQQPVFTCTIDGRLVCKYIADFSYRLADSGLFIVADVKGVETDTFRLKKKLVEALYPGTVISVWPPKKRKARKRKAA